MRDAPIRLVVSDIDGTLVRHDKSLPPANVAAMRELVARGVAVSLISARPPAGILPIAQAIGLAGPFGAFNGGTIFTASGQQGEPELVPVEIGARMVALFAEHRVTCWLFTADQWMTSDITNSHSPREVLSSALQPHEVADFRPWLAAASKIVAVCDDAAAMARIELAARDLAGDSASVVRSQAYYLDVTAVAANKGDGLTRLAKIFSIPLDQVAVLGDQANDVPMFQRAGMAIVMGQAPDAVKANATYVTSSNEDCGVAEGIARFILPSVRRPSA